MGKVFVHLSDLHYVSGKSESYGVVLKALFDDLNSILKVDPSNRYLLLSGDVVKEGSQDDNYNNFLQTIAPKLDGLGITRERRICVPGNHDVDRELLKASLLEHEGLILQCADEDIFVNFVRGKKSVITEKFDKYGQFENEFAAYGVGAQALGAGHALSDSCGVFCLNSAYFSSGGLEGVKGPISDRGRLAVDTRGLHSWIQSTSFETRILVMHHPLDWLATWSSTEIRALLGKEISLLVTGHTHNQDVYLNRSSSGECVHCLAPALFTRKTDDLGYGVIYMDSDGSVEKIEYRQWVSKSQMFVTGTSLSSTNDGIVAFHPKLASAVIPKATSGHVDVPTPSSDIGQVLKARLDSSMQYFYGQPSIFVEPILSDFSEVTASSSEKARPTFGIDELVKNNFPIVVHAPPQFGLSCLARYFCYRAWTSQKKIWLYVDALVTKPHRKAVVDAIQSELDALGITMALVHGVVVDSVRSSERDSSKLVEKFAELYPGMDVVFMRSNDGSGGMNLTELGGKHVKDVFLWSMARSSMRSMVAQYNDERPLGDEDVVISRLAQDLETMNIHRTPLNCFTLLKASEALYEDSPVNRAELLKRVLYQIFNSDRVPTYKSRPDVKDCEFVLGYFCEKIVKSGVVRFRREEFKVSITKFCSDNLIEIDAEWVFDVLYKNNIIISRGLGFEFKFVSWVMYFAAQRMCQSDSFRKFIFDAQRYAAYPEIIEFYTGINRSMNDAICTLMADLREAIGEFDRKIALPNGFDVFSVAQWTPSPVGLEQMKADTVDGVERSNLPDAVKDQYADRNYDRAKPYAQDLGELLEGYSYNKMLQTMRAAAKALRNSDYVETTLKTELLSEILAVWERAATVILVLIPALAKNGEAAFEDVGYVLHGDFPESTSDRFMAVLQVIPVNVSGYYQDDLFSHKMAPLLAREIGASGSRMTRHLLAHVLIRNRPRNWAAWIREHIDSLPKNSFYLLDLYKALRNQYKFGYLSQKGLDEVAFLIKKCAAKHVTGAKELGSDKVERIASNLSVADGDLLPTRLVDEHGEIISQAQSDTSATTGSD